MLEKGYQKRISEVDRAFEIKNNDREALISDIRRMFKRQVCLNLLASKYSDFKLKVTTDYLRT